MKERKIMEKPPEEEKSLEISLRTNQIKILYEIYAKDQAIQRKKIGTVICHNATIARSSGTQRKIVATKIGMNLISQKSMIKKNVCSMTLKTQSKKNEEVVTLIVDT